MATQSQAKSHLNKLIGSNSPDIPSGYTLTQLCNCTYNTSVDTTYIYNTLLSKLSNSTDINTKFKCIRTIKYCVINGSPEFKQLCQRNNTSIRDCTTYRIQSIDTMTGNSANNRLNNEANECIKMIFDDSIHSTTRVKMDGISSNGSINNDDRSTLSVSKLYKSRSGDDDNDIDHDSNGYSASRYGGYGSSIPSNSNTSTNKYSTAASIFTNKLSSTANTIANVVSDTVRSNQYASDIVDRVSNKIHQYNPSKSNKQASINSSLSYIGNNSYTHNGYNNTNNSNHSFNGFDDNNASSKQPQKASYQVPHSSAQSSVTTSNHTVNGNDDYTLEYRLVDSITAQSGIKSIPTNPELSQFVQSIQPLDIDIILDRLIQYRLHSTQPVSIKLKSLAVLQYIISQNNDLSQHTISYIQQHTQYIEALNSTTNTQLRARVNSILASVGQPSPHHTTQTHNNISPPPTTIDLLNFTDDSKPASTKTNSTAEFDLLDMNHTNQSYTSPAISPLPSSGSFDFMADLNTNTINQSQPPHRESVDEMFGDMSLKSNSTQILAHISQHNNSNTGNSSNDLLNFSNNTRTNQSDSLLDTFNSIQLSSNDPVSQLLHNQQQKQQHANFFPAAQQLQHQPSQSQLSPFEFNVSSTTTQQSNDSNNIPFVSRPASNRSTSDFSFMSQSNPGKPSSNTISSSNNDSFSFVNDLLKQ